MCSQRADDSFDHSNGLLSYFEIPNPHDAPTRRGQVGVDASVSLNVAFDLLVPVCA
jgi:hypothetical protein